MNIEKYKVNAFDHAPLPMRAPRIIILVIFLLVAPIIADSLVQGYAIALQSHDVRSQIWIPITAQIVVAILAVIIGWPLFAEGKARNQSLKERISRLLKVYVGLVVVQMVIGYAVQFVMERLGGGGQAVNQDTLQGMTQVGMPLFFIFAAVTGPIVEELLFRGLIFRPLVVRHRGLAYSVSAGLFGFIHVVAEASGGDWVGLINIVPYVIMGLAFCYIYERSESLWSAIVLHMLWNTLAVVSLFQVI